MQVVSLTNLPEEPDAGFVKKLLVPRVASGTVRSMANTIKRFTYSVCRMRLGDALPIPPTVVIELNFGITAPSGLPAISANLTSSEIDWEIDALKADLDAVRVNAKKALRKAEEDTQRIVSQRIARDSE